MDWGTELWDQFDNVDKHHQHEIEFVEKYAKFVKERSSIEVEYASKLRKLVKAFNSKKKDDEQNRFSTHKAFSRQLSELNDIAGQHEIVGEEMLANINKVLTSFCNELKVEKKKLYQDGRNQQNILDQHEKALEQTKKKFEKEWKDCERAHAYFLKLDGDVNVTKIDVEKAKHAWMSRKDSVENCKTDYGASLQTFNKEQQQHYTCHMPKLFKAYKDADGRRIAKSRELMIEYAKIDLKVKPLVKKCLEEMENAGESVDAEQDAQMVVEKHKSGFSPPPDKEFEDCTQPQQPQKNPTENGAEIKPATKKGGRSWFRKNKPAESPDFSHLPPEQRRKKLLKLINELKKDINKEEEGRKGLMKMQEVYRANPALGDPNSLAGQMKILTSKLDKLQAHLAQLETWHADACGSVHSPATRNTPSRPVSTVSIEKQPDTVPAPPPYKEAAADFPEVPPPPPLAQESDQNEEATVPQDDFDEEPVAIGTCVALYDFEAASDGALSMTAGETFTVIEEDSGDGWTRAMRGDRDGYVPTTYLEVTFYS